jgi:hypothetical protein
MALRSLFGPWWTTSPGRTCLWRYPRRAPPINVGASSDPCSAARRSPSSRCRPCCASAVTGHIVSRRPANGRRIGVLDHCQSGDHGVARHWRYVFGVATVDMAQVPVRWLSACPRRAVPAAGAAHLCVILRCFTLMPTGLFDVRMDNTSSLHVRSLLPPWIRADTPALGSLQCIRSWSQSWPAAAAACRVAHDDAAHVRKKDRLGLETRRRDCPAMPVA